MTIAENIAAIREKIDAAARETGRTGKDIMLLGACKMNDADRCRQAVAAGIDALGENRVQEMQEKLPQGAYEGVPFHFIGHLQRNKVKNVVGIAALIHSVGSLELLEEIEKQAAKLDIVQPVLLEVNIGREEAKSGFAPEAVEQAAAHALTLPHVQVKGLMAIPPIAVGAGGNTPYFEEMYRLFIDINKKMYDNTWEYISMGMSGDYEDAIRCGANLVRVGSGIFGQRNYNKT